MKKKEKGYLVKYTKLNSKEKFIMMECVICLDNINDSLSCTNRKCRIVICSPCLLDLFTRARENNSLPLCPAIGCGYHYDWKELSKEHQIAYGKACLFYYSSIHSGDIDIIRNKPMLIEDLQRKRIEYLSLMPVAVLHVVEIALKAKLRKVKKTKTKEAPKRKCMNLRCVGVLNDDFTCIVCSTSFCRDCEKRWNDNHQCKTEDIESISIIRKMVHCPNCGLVIEKSEGCNHMTCASCGNKFEYSTGNASNHGSHNKPVILKQNTLSILWEDIINKTSSPHEFKEQVILLEKKEVKNPTERPILSLIASTKNNDVIILNVLRAFDKYYKKLEKYREYVNIVDEIQYKMTNRDLSIKELERLVNSL